jgi:hypothetical protein
VFSLLYVCHLYQEGLKMTLVAVNENGVRVGESHPRVRLTDWEVELIRILHEEDSLGYRRLAAIFEVSKRTIRDICHYRRRAETVVAWVEPRQAQRERRKATLEVRMAAGDPTMLDPCE